ncbi:uncharacterized protein LOC125856140 [Solanum stenotomum]|uniref:uncharacterized protein LOC125856140 n=1 Tax=Solanum stenotomum TaxID=172797 RepID=UPI0020D12859|nr:uncharacterized protein LOC125856140 [Solanum stenotomum]
MILKGAFNINYKDGYPYLMRTLIYDSRFKVSEETAMAMAWFSFPNLLSTFIVKECLFSIVAAVGKPIHFDQATRHSCARVKVLRAHGLIEAYIFALDALTVRFEACEQGRGDSATVTTLKADIIGMRKDVDELKSTDLSMLFSTVEIPNIPSTDVPPSSEIPPATTTGDVAMVTVDAEFEAEIDEKEHGVREEAMYNDLADFEGAMI